MDRGCSAEPTLAAGTWDPDLDVRPIAKGTRTGRSAQFRRAASRVAWTRIGNVGGCKVRVRTGLSQPFATLPDGLEDPVDGNLEMSELRVDIVVDPTAELVSFRCCGGQGFLSPGLRRREDLVVGDQPVSLLLARGFQRIGVCLRLR